MNIKIGYSKKMIFLMHPGVPSAARTLIWEVFFALPPFGKQLIRFESDTAELIGVETVEGMALAECSGSPSAVLDLIETAFPATWNLNAPADSPIFKEINRRGHLYMPLPCAKRMVLHLSEPSYIPYISILERI